MKKNFRNIVLSLILCCIFSLSPIKTYGSVILEADVSGIKNAVVFNMTDQIMLYSKGMNERVQTASLTKIVTAITSLEYMNIDTIITVGDEIEMIKPMSSVCALEKGWKMSLGTLISGMLIASGNDAAYTVAVNTARYVSKNPSMSNKEAVQYFCNLMNRCAYSVFAYNSHFVNPDGWDDPSNYSTPGDLIKIIYKFLDNKFLASVVSKAVYSYEPGNGETVVWQNTNSFLDKNSKYYYSPVKGIKTGTTDDAGLCLAALGEKNDKEVLIIVMGCRTEDDRYLRVKELFEQAFCTDSPFRTLGDVDGSGTTDAFDARMILRYSVRLISINKGLKQFGDVNSDGRIDSYDARFVLRISVGLENINKEYNEASDKDALFEIS